MEDNQENKIQKTKTVINTLTTYFGDVFWENKLPPIDELVSTILSQNTNDINRDKGFKSLKQAFKAWEEVRDAPLEKIIDAIRPAGLANQKGNRIQQVLQQITDQRGELNIDFLRDMPSGEAKKWLIAFKGVGPKTAAIVLQYSLDVPAFAVDTHVFRIIKRLGLIGEKINANKAHEIMEKLASPDSYYALHIHMISLGREICHPRTPACEKCPLSKSCDYYHNTFLLN